MKFNLTPVLAKTIKDVIERDRGEKMRAAMSVNVLTATPEQIASLKSAFEAADANWNAVKTLTAGNVDFSGSAGTLTWEIAPDNRPAGWMGGFAYRVKSRTGGKDHEVCASITSGLVVTSCNCIGGRFGEKCWAQKDVAASITGRGNSVSGNRNFTRVWADPYRDPDFGLIKPQEG